ncbi:MAG TPA: LamG-like jellyroll fold domain-containing protein [Ignavibacteriales bacterium]|nr:LamG-like jellyroll fold domain-containing protein [Ignavibacteriales bacterium]
MKKVFQLFILSQFFLLAAYAGLALGQGELPQEGLKHYYTFDNASDLYNASIGNDLVPDALAGSAQSFEAVSGTKAGDGALKIGMGSFLRCSHDFEPNGIIDTAKRVNQYTIVMDVLLPARDVWHTLYAGDNNSDAALNDWELFIKDNGTLGIGSTGYSYDTLTSNQWYRVVVSADLGAHLGFYVDGQIAQDGGTRTLDDRFSLSSIDEANQILFFGDNDGEDADIIVTTLALYDRAFTDEEIEALGGYGHFIEFGKPVAEWRFDDPADLTSAAMGKALTLTGEHEAAAGPSDNNGAVKIGAGSYYSAETGITPNGKYGTPDKVNRYTLVFDFKIPFDGTWYSFYSTNTDAAADDAEFFIRNTDSHMGSDEAGFADTVIKSGDWYKLAIVADLGKSYTYYLDGDSIYSTDDLVFDGRFALDPKGLANKFLLFADNDGQDGEIHIANVSLYNRPLSTTEVKALGGYEHAVSSEITPALQAITVDGSDKNQYVSIPYSADFDFGETKSFTVEVWIQPKILSNGDPSIISNKDWGSGGNPGWILSLRDGDWKFNIADQNKNRKDFNGLEIDDEKWHYVAVSLNRDSQAVVLITDTLQSIPLDITGLGDINNPMPINIGQDGTGNYSDGYKLPASIDEVRIWSAAVDPGVLKAWSHKEITEAHPNYGDLMAYYKFNEGTGTEISDASGNGYTAEIKNGATWKVSYAPIAQSSLAGASDVAAIWESVNSSVSGGLTASSSFSSSLAKNFSAEALMFVEEKYLTFGHNNLTGAVTTGVPSGVEGRFRRVWNTYATETFSNQISFSFQLANPGAADNYVLLYSADPAGNYAIVSGTAAVVDMDVVSFSNVTLPAKSGYYTLGTKNAQASPLGSQIGIEDLDNNLPKAYALENAYPNPFNPSTTIKFALPADSKVVVSIYNVLGQEVTKLINGAYKAGVHSVQWNAVGLSSGLYIYKITAQGTNGQNFVSSKKLMLLK